MKTFFLSLVISLVALVTFPSISSGNYVSDLFDQVQFGNLDKIESLLNMGVDIDTVNRDGLTPLMKAIEANKYNIIEYLISKGANVNQNNDDGYSALHFACMKGDKIAVNILLAHGADIEAQSKTGINPLFISLLTDYTDIFDLLLEKGADINARLMIKDSYGYPGSTILHQIVKLGEPDEIDFLLSKGANLESRNSRGYTPLGQAAGSDNLEMVRLLVEKGAYVNAIGEYGITPLSSAESSEMKGNATLLKKYGAWSHFEPDPKQPEWLDKCVEDEVNTFVSNGGNINECDENGYTALHWVAKERKSSWRTSFLESFVNNKANLESSSADGTTPLHLCCYSNNISLAKILLKNGVNPNIQNKNLESPLHYLCTDAGGIGTNGFTTEKEEAMVKLLLEYKADINIPDVLERTPIYYALKSIGNTTPYVRFLISNGANINQQDFNLETPLHHSIEYSSEIVKLLLESGANPESKNVLGQTAYEIAESQGKRNMMKLFDNYKGMCCLYHAAHYGSLDYIKDAIQKGENINTTNDKGLSPLHATILNNNPKATKLLIELGANINLQCSEGKTPLYYAIKNNNLTMIKILLDHQASADISSSDGTNCLGLAYALCYTAIYDILKEKYPNLQPLYKNTTQLKDIRKEARKTVRYNRYKKFNSEISDLYSWHYQSQSPLHEAVILGEKENVNSQLARGDDINGFDAKGRTPLVCASNLDNEEMVNLLLYNGADINKLDKERGESALHRAAYSGCGMIIDLLLEKGADINIKSLSGKTPLHVSVSDFTHDSMETLLEHGAEIDAEDNSGRTPLMYAVKRLDHNKIKCLLNHGADVTKFDKNGKNLISLVFENWEDFGQEHIDMIAYLIDIGVDCNIKTKDGRDLLHKATEIMSIPLMTMLLEKGFEVNSKDINGNMPIHIHTNPYVVTKGNHYGVMSVLIKYGADINAIDSWDNSPLHGLAELNRPKVAKLLIDNGANINIKNNWGATPLHIAVTNKNYEMVKLLLENKADPKISNKYKQTPLDSIKHSKDEKSTKIKELLMQY